VTLRQPTVVRHYRERAASMSGATILLETFEGEGAVSNWPAIGLLAVHASIALADAVLVATEGTHAAGDDHGAAARRLRSWCSANGLPAEGIKHFEWLLDKKTPFSYAERHVREDDLQNAKIKMEQFFVWVFRTFPLIASTESTDA
jgi:hypothetical protein